MSGIGNINNAGGIGYTDMTGLGLTSSVQNQIKVDAAVSTAMSNDILSALAQFRAQGNFNPTAAEMEAKLSVAGVAAKQNDINQAQDLLFGLQQTYQFAMQQTGGNADGRTMVWCQLVESGGTVPANATVDGVPSKVAGKSISGVFGGAVANYPGGPEALLSSLIPDTFNTNTALDLPPGYWGDGHLTPSTMQTMITALQAKIANMKSADPSSFRDTTGATQMTAAQWLSREMGVQSPHDSYSIDQWAAIAQKLQVNAAIKTSELNIGNGGGIQQVNGQYFVNGQEMSLSQVNFCVRANQYELIDQQIADQMNAIQENNKKAKQAHDVLAAIEAYDGEDINVIQTATMSAEYIDGQGGGAWGMVQHYLNNNFGVTATSSPSYADCEMVINTGFQNLNPLSSADMNGIGNALSYITDTTGVNPNHPTSLKSLIDSCVTNNNTGRIAGYLIGNTYSSCLATKLGLSSSASYSDLVAKLAVVAPGFSPPASASAWTGTNVDNLQSALNAKQTIEQNKQTLLQMNPSTLSTIGTNVSGFFSTMKTAAPDFYSKFVTDTNGGPPYKFAGTITNSDYNNLKTAFGTYMQNNSTDNQVAQQRLDSLNNTRQAILTGMSAFTQGQSQSTNQIANNL